MNKTQETPVQEKPVQEVSQETREAIKLLDTQRILRELDIRQVDIKQPETVGRYIYSVFHTLMSLAAIYLAYRCNKGFELGPFLVACCCPYLYIIYVLATKGTCGILEK